MRPGLPIAISGTVTTSAEGCAFRQFQLTAITGLELLEIILIMTIEAEVIAVVGTVAHDNVGMFRWNDEIVFVIEL